MSDVPIDCPRSEETYERLRVLREKVVQELNVGRISAYLGVHLSTASEVRMMLELAHLNGILSVANKET